MTVQVKVLVPAKTVENTQITQYTATNVTTIIDKFTATNYSAAAATIRDFIMVGSPLPPEVRLRCYRPRS